MFNIFKTQIQFVKFVLSITSWRYLEDVKFFLIVWNLILNDQI